MGLTHTRRCETGHSHIILELMLAYLVCALLSSSASAIWPFTQKRFKNSLIDSGSLGIDGNARIVAFGDFNSDQ
jgi:integrin alpha FG-GAP repeat containing protein 1